MADENNTKNLVYAILDLETTGLSRKQDRIVQIACLKIGKDGSKTTWMRYVNPQMDSEYLKQGGFLIHKIPPEFLLTKPPFEEIAESFCDFLKDVDFLVGHNCVFDWDMLCREFQILDVAEKREDNSKADVSKLWWERFHSKYNWLDTIRLAMLRFPNQDSYRLDAVRELLNIDPQSGIDGALSAEGDHGGDQWKPQKHDAMYDVLTTYGILQHCMKTTFNDLVQDFSLAVVDTSLFLDMQRLLNQNRTSRDDLLPIAKRSREYFTTSRPKGKKLGDLSNYFLQKLIISLKADTRSDDRVILIYEAAFLDPLENELPSQSSTSTKDNSEKEGIMGNKREEDNKKEEEEKEEKEEREQGEEENTENELPFHLSLSTKDNSEKDEKMGNKREDDDKKEEGKKEEKEVEEQREEENTECSSQKRPKLSDQENEVLNLVR